VKDSTLLQIRTFLHAHGIQIFFPVLFCILTVFSFCICGKPAAGELLIAEWGTRYLLFPVLGIAAALSVLHRPFLALSVYLGYHAGLVLAVIGTDPGEAQFLYAKITVILTVLIVVILGFWMEFFASRKTSRPSENPESGAHHAAAK